MTACMLPFRLSLGLLLADKEFGFDRDNDRLLFGIRVYKDKNEDFYAKLNENYLTTIRPLRLNRVKINENVCLRFAIEFL